MGSSDLNEKVPGTCRSMWRDFFHIDLTGPRAFLSAPRECTGQCPLESFPGEGQAVERVGLLQPGRCFLQRNPTRHVTGLWPSCYTWFVSVWPPNTFLLMLQLVLLWPQLANYTRTVKLQSEVSISFYGFPIFPECGESRNQTLIPLGKISIGPDLSFKKYFPFINSKAHDGQISEKIFATGERGQQRERLCLSVPSLKQVSCVSGARYAPPKHFFLTCVWIGPGEVM